MSEHPFLKALYTLNKVLAIAAGAYIVFFPPFTLVGTLSSAIMVIAALVSIYAIWTDRIEVEFVSLAFVVCGVSAYAGFAWVSGEYFVRAMVSAMLLVMLVARAGTLWIRAKQIRSLERLLRDNG